MQELPKTKALVVDGMPLTRFALISLIRLHPQMLVCGEAGTACEARDRCSETHPDVVVLDIEVSHGDGLGLIGELRRLHTPLQLLVVSARDDAQSIQRSFRAGARAYLSKNDEPAELHNALDAVLAGRIFMGTRIAQRILENFAGWTHDRLFNQLSALSDRELCVFQMLGQGKGASSIARELSVSVKTVETHQHLSLIHI